MGCFHTAVLRGGDMPKVIQQVLPEGYKGGSFGSLGDPFDEGRKFLRRYAVDVRAEFKRAMARRRFFTYWTPEMEGQCSRPRRVPGRYGVRNRDIQQEGVEITDGV